MKNEKGKMAVSRVIARNALPSLEGLGVGSWS